MIILNVTYKCKPGMREEFLRTIKAEGLDTASRAEEGNTKYDFYFAAEDPDEMLLVEFWRDEEALDLHHAEPHFIRLSKLKETFVDETVKKVFTA